MESGDLHRAARNIVTELPGAEVYSFTLGWEAARVREKWFLLFSERDGQPLVIVKADPQDVIELVETVPEITPGYHMNKRHWLTIAPGDDVDSRLLKQLITESYLLVVASLPRARRPVDPTSYAAAVQAARQPHDG